MNDFERQNSERIGTQLELCRLATAALEHLELSGWHESATNDAGEYLNIKKVSFDALKTDLLDRAFSGTSPRNSDWIRGEIGIFVSESVDDPMKLQFRIGLLASTPFENYSLGIEFDNDILMERGEITEFPTIKVSKENDFDGEIVHEEQANSATLGALVDIINTSKDIELPGDESVIQLNPIDLYELFREENLAMEAHRDFSGLVLSVIDGLNDQEKHRDNIESTDYGYYEEVAFVLNDFLVERLRDEMEGLKLKRVDAFSVLYQEDEQVLGQKQWCLDLEITDLDGTSWMIGFDLTKDQDTGMEESQIRIETEVITGDLRDRLETIFGNNDCINDEVFSALQRILRQLFE